MDLKRYTGLKDSYPKVNKYGCFYLIDTFKIMLKECYLSFAYYNFQLVYSYYRTKILLEIKRLVNKNLLINKPKEEVLNGRYSLYLMAK